MTRNSVGVQTGNERREISRRQRQQKGFNNALAVVAALEMHTHHILLQVFIL